MGIIRGMPMKFSKAMGKPIEQFALQDYPKFSYFLKEGRFFGRDASDTSQHIYELLNSYKCVENCKSHHGCDETATKISIAGNSQYGYSVSKGFVWCEEHKDEAFMAHNAQLYQIKHDLIPTFYHKGDKKQIQKVMNELAGFTGKITATKAIEFFEDLESRL